MKVLHVVPAFYPASFWGGPIFSTKMICDEVSRLPEFEIEVLTTDSAGLQISDRVKLVDQDFGYPVHFTRRIAGHSIAPGLVWRLFFKIRAADIVHLTSTYSFPTLPTLLIARLMKKPVVWSLRGAVQATEEWKESPRRQLKRRFHDLARLIMSSGTIIHVTAETERVASLSAIPNTEFFVIPNGVYLPTLLPKRSNSFSHEVKLMFLSRLHPKKGIERLLDAMKGLPPYFVLDIYGSGEPDYESYLRERIKILGRRVKLHGHVEGYTKSEAFRKADIFVLPSFSENFGIAIAEALAHGLPVLTTSATPWAGLSAKGCGECIDPVSGDIAAALLEMAAGDLATMGQNGRKWMEEDFSPMAMGRQFAALYSSIGGRVAKLRMDET